MHVLKEKYRKDGRLKIKFDLIGQKMEVGRASSLTDLLLQQDFNIKNKRKFIADSVRPWSSNVESRRGPDASL